jgi:hypothetical protein
VFAKGVGPPAVGGDDAECAGAVDQDSKIVRAALGGLENPDGVIEESHELPYRTVGEIFEESRNERPTFNAEARRTRRKRGDNSLVFLRVVSAFSAPPR